MQNYSSTSFWTRLMPACLAALFLSSCTLSMEYNRAQAIKAVGTEYATGKISRKQHDREVADIRKAYAEYEAKWIAQMNAGSQNNQSTSGYGYTPQPEMVYVQNAPYHPGGGEFTPQPQMQYVYNTPHQAGGGEFTPPPQQQYVYNTPHRPGGGEFTPPPQQQYVYNTPAPQQGGVYTPAPQMKYKYRSEMTAAEQKAFDKSYGHKTYPIQADTHKAFEDNYAAEQRRLDNLGPTGKKIMNGLTEVAAAAAIKGPKIPVKEPTGFLGWLFKKPSAKIVEEANSQPSKSKGASGGW